MKTAKSMEENGSASIEKLLSAAGERQLACTLVLLDPKLNSLGRTHTPAVPADFCLKFHLDATTLRRWKTID